MHRGAHQPAGEATEAHENARRTIADFVGAAEDEVAAHEDVLTARALQLLQEIPGVHIIGPRGTEDRGSAVSFAVDGIHPHAVGQVLDERGVAVRTGHHCARPIVRRYGVPATTRATFYVYNTLEEVEQLAEGVRAAQVYFGT
ncbi:MULTISPECIES: aminotransferase class V-fold PLP-dependent enzyme [unclassified Streptomyces]|uniref:aminotransferase class V-fold PLP-dependent enzyme n=1 Tax=unclassified Streptomyces TaxID=2593676 RepID=UPI0036487F55